MKRDLKTLLTAQRETAATAPYPTLAIRRELAILEARMRVRPSQPLAAEIMRLRALLTAEHGS